MHWPTDRVRTSALLGLATGISVAAVFWPLFATSEALTRWHGATGTVLVLALLPITIMLIANDIVSSHFTNRTLAIVGILTALATVVRPLGAGVAGIEPIWIVIIIAGRALGAAIGFVLGMSSLLVSAIVTGGVGPWLPYQMVVAAWIAMAAGLLPLKSNRAERWLLAGFAALSTFLYGWVLNLWFWQNLSGLQSGIGFDAAAAAPQRTIAWVHYNLVTSFGFDLPRACLTAAGILLVGPRLTQSIRRANRESRYVSTTARP